MAKAPYKVKPVRRAVKKPSATPGKVVRLSNRAPGGIVPVSRIVRSNNRWRDQYNPLRGLVISRIVTMLEDGERGWYADLQWLYRFVEKRFAILRSLIARRRAALLKLDWDIKVRSKLPSTATPEMVNRQQQFLRAKYEHVENFSETIRWLALAEFRGFTILQKHRDSRGWVRQFHWLPQWNWVRDGQDGAWFWNEEAQNVSHTLLGDSNRIGSEELPRSEFIIREEDMPINEIAAVAFVNCGMAKKDWVAFVEMFGLPGCVITLPPNIPSGDEDAYQSTAEAVAEASSGVVPNGSSVNFPSAQIRGGAPFKEFLDAEKEDVVIAGTGGKLTMLNEATGIGGSQGDVHQDAFDDLAQGEAATISEVLQKDFDRWELSAAFPGEPHLVYFQLAAEDQEDADALATRIQTLNNAGLEVDAQEASEKTGLKLTRVVKPAPVLPGAFRNRADQQQLAKALAADLQPWRERLAAILQITDPELQRRKLEQLKADFIRLKQNIQADPQTAREIERLMAQGLSTAFNA